MKKKPAMKRMTAMKKLHLNRETLLRLGQEIHNVRGGTGSYHDDCTGFQCSATNSIDLQTCNCPY